jgi:3-oxoadipate enol-lactonase
MTMSAVQVKDQFVATRWGRIHCRKAGADGIPLILLHSNGASAHEFEHVLGQLAERQRVLAWDMPGQGDSDPLPRHLSVPDYAAAVVDLMEQLGIARASVVGSSIGGSICIALAARHPTYFETIVAVETPCRPPEEWAAQWHVTERMFAIPTQTAEQIMPRLRVVDDALVTRWNIDRNKAGPKTMMSVMWALRDYDIVSDMERIDRPVTAVFGGKSALRSRATLFTEKIRNCTVQFVEDCGHFPMIDDPKGFSDIINRSVASANC